MKHWGVEAGDKVGVIGLGGLGHMAVKLATALGANVTVFTTSDEKVGLAKSLGATEVVLEADAKKQAKTVAPFAGSFDFILSTVPEKHDINPFVILLKRDKTLCIVGALEPMAGVNNQTVAFHRRGVAGSLIGSIAETQEVLDFCAAHDIASDVEIIPIQDINKAYKEIERGGVHFRYVIDMSSLGNEAHAGE